MQLEAEVRAVPSDSVVGLHSCIHHDLWLGSWTVWITQMSSIFNWRLSTANEEARWRLERGRREKLVFIHVVPSQQDCLRLAVPLFDRKSLLLLRQNVLHDSITSSLPFSLWLEKEDAEVKVSDSSFNGFLHILPLLLLNIPHTFIISPSIKKSFSIFPKLRRSFFSYPVRSLTHTEKHYNILHMKKQSLKEVKRTCLKSHTKGKSETGTCICLTAEHMLFPWQQAEEKLTKGIMKEKQGNKQRTRKMHGHSF